MNYFKLFNLTNSYTIDLEKLNKYYKKLQLKYHPDRCINQTDDEKRETLHKSTIINTGYQVLVHPLYRAEHILTLNNVNINNKANNILNKNFLKEQMDWWEELKILEHSLDIKKKISIYYSKLTKITQQYYNILEIQLNNKKWTLAMNTVIKLRFFNKLIQYLDKLEEKSLYFR
uniref:Co-chaperone protein HscB n=1 Tax=Candidatus Aschnera chinzeii TaxID=1485666 RepID=A0AAT9G536_9ENTR|nr:MAG: Fe-S protein assembly co-chaperone HscB [Candidatus Aschnera chinzeii]